MAMSALKQPFQQHFPFLPDYSTWDDWNGNFTIWYGQSNITVLPEDQWRDVANAISASEAFSAYPVKSPDTFENWQDWASELTAIINGPVY